MSNETVLKRIQYNKRVQKTFAPVSNETVLKPSNSLFSFQQLTINISSPIVVTRAFARHCGAIQSTILSGLLSNKESDDSINVGLKTSTNERLFYLFI